MKKLQFLLGNLDFNTPKLPKIIQFEGFEDNFVISLDYLNRMRWFCPFFHQNENNLLWYPFPWFFICYSIYLEFSEVVPIIKCCRSPRKLFNLDNWFSPFLMFFNIFAIFCLFQHNITQGYWLKTAKKCKWPNVE